MKGAIFDLIANLFLKPYISPMPLSMIAMPKKKINKSEPCLQVLHKKQDIWKRIAWQSLLRLCLSQEHIWDQILMEHKSFQACPFALEAGRKISYLTPSCGTVDHFLGTHSATPVGDWRLQPSILLFTILHPVAFSEKYHANSAWHPSIFRVTVSAVWRGLILSYSTSWPCQWTI